MNFASLVRRALRPLETRVANMVKRAIVERVLDSERIQLVQASMLEDEVQDRIEHMQPYGLSFNVPTGAEGVVLAVQGAGSHRVLLCPSKRGDRPTGAQVGEGGLYSLGEWQVFIDQDGNVILGGGTEGASELARADRTDAEIQRIWDLLTSWTPVAQDGGAALQTAANVAVETVQSTASDKVRGT
jgi:phage gp45-like